MIYDTYSKYDIIYTNIYDNIYYIYTTHIYTSSIF